MKRHHNLESWGYGRKLVIYRKKGCHEKMLTCCDVSSFLGICVLLCLVFCHLEFLLMAVFQLKNHKGAVSHMLSGFPV